MKKNAYVKCRDVQFQIGDLVLVKLQPYRQVSVANRLSHKLSARYFGPFKVLKKIGQVEYQLELLVTTKIHDVFYVSVLKLYNGEEAATLLAIPQQVVHRHPILEPYRVLQSRVISKDGVAGMQVLIQWHNLSITEAIWEDVDSFKLDFPTFNLEDKVLLNGGCIDVTQQLQEDLEEINEGMG